MTESDHRPILEGLQQQVEEHRHHVLEGPGRRQDLLPKALEDLQNTLERLWAALDKCWLRQRRLTPRAPLSTIGELATTPVPEPDQPLCTIHTFFPTSLRLIRPRAEDSGQFIHSLERYFTRLWSTREIIHRLRRSMDKESIRSTVLIRNALCAQPCVSTILNHQNPCYG